MRSHLVVSLALAAVAALTPTAAPARETCETLDACLARISAMAKLPGNYADSMTQEEIALVERVLTFDQAVPRLMPLLADPDERVANIAAAALRDAKYIDPVYLPQVIAGLNRGLGWLPPALGRMPSDAAAREAVARFLVSESAPGNQEAYAVELSGVRAVPFIVDAAKCPNGCKPEDQTNLAHVLHEMDPAPRTMAGRGLMNIVLDEKTTRLVALGALGMIASLNSAGKDLEGELLKVRTRRADLTDAVNAALVGIHADASADILAARLKQLTNKEEVVYVLRDLAETGATGRQAGTEVLRLLTNSNWDTRLAAARALGFIDYQPAVPMLTQALNDPSDVRLNWVAAESLGKLADRAAVDALQRAADEHWYPPVRQAAAMAAQHIRDGTRYEDKFQPGDFRFEFFGYQDIGRDVSTCERPLIGAKPESKAQKLYSKQDSEKLQALTYEAAVISYAPAEPAKSAKKKGEADVVEMNADNMVRHRKAIQQVPNFALRVARGWFAGASRGEWGGELMFLGDDHSQQLVLNENVEDIYLLGDRVVAITGLAHLGFNDGMIYEIARDSDGKWAATRWRRLPGAPKTSWPVETGELLANVWDGGTILLAADGSMRMAPCQAMGDHQP